MDKSLAWKLFRKGVLFGATIPASPWVEIKTDGRSQSVLAQISYLVSFDINEGGPSRAYLLGPTVFIWTRQAPLQCSRRRKIPEQESLRSVGLLCGLYFDDDSVQAAYKNLSRMLCGALPVNVTRALVLRHRPTITKSKL